MEGSFVNVAEPSSSSLASPTGRGTPAGGLRLLAASAGSGKTTRLTQVVTDAVSPSAPSQVPIEGLVGVTYTTKAHAALETRIRSKLIQHGALERAQELPLAYVGTVHSVCLRLVKEFALDAGVSPTVDVIPGNEGRRLLQAALEHELDFATQTRIQELAAKFDFELLAQLRRYDWVLPVDELMTLARNNRIAPEALPAMARRSIEGLMALLPPPATSGHDLEAQLGGALEKAIAELSSLDDTTAVTGKALSLLRESATNLRFGRLSWPEWAKLSSVAPSKRAAPLVATVHEAAAFSSHPRFRAELCELTEKLFEAARVGLVAYASWKAQRGLVDYVDMIDRALDILSVPEVQDELRDRLKLVVVDEFQDTSPIQLALFTRLHTLSGRSVWVGDRKQCIFEYAGADPALMEAATRWVNDNGGDTESLEVNYRSRPELVEVVSTVFPAAFALHGHAEREVATAPDRPALADLEPLPPLGLFWLHDDAAAALAAGVARLLSDPASTPVLDRTSKTVRPVRASDIAVLVHSNLEAARIAEELAARGVPTVLPRVGLLTTPEGTFVTAALRFLVDRWDTLALAELDALTGFQRFSPQSANETAGAKPCELWLTERIRQRRLRATEDEGNPASAPAPTPEHDGTLPGPAVALDRLRSRLQHLSPAETLDEVLAALDVARLAVAWPDPEQRLANLDALRALATTYEERCSYQRETASLPGLLRYFEETQQTIRQRDEERATDEQHVARNGNAVVVSTYHKAKGLEWPVVILASLGRDRRRDAFNVTPESDRDHFDAGAPLAGRWIRFWPWPLGAGGRTDSPLALRAENSPAGRAVAEREARERVRLLYVGFTRARDHVILAIHRLKKGPSRVWLDELHDDQGPLVVLPEPTATEPKTILRGLRGQRVEVKTRMWSLQPGEKMSGAPAPSEQRYWFAPTPCTPEDAPSYWIAPSGAAQASLALPAPRIVSSTRFTRRMPFATPKGVTFDEVGNALHAFLAADRVELDGTQRVDLAERVLRRADLTGFIEADAVIAASDALRGFVSERWPSAIWHRELPVTALLDTPHGQRRIAGSIDLVLETPSGYVVIDHKSFPGRASEWEERALRYAPQLMTYAMALRMAGREVAGMFVHFTIGGGMVEVGEVRR